MDLPARVERVFSPSGPLARASKGYRQRQGQIDMAMAVAHTVEQGGALVVEAGTGIGKTFAYLVPALLSAKRVLVSTGSKILQDQIAARDIPALAAVLGIAPRVMVLKGRSSYLCQQRFASLVEEEGESQNVANLYAWSQATTTGDLAEIPGLDDRSPIWERVTSTRDNCLGAQCPRAATCYVNQARRAAKDCDVLVVNHHLFFADFDTREAAGGHLLPIADCVVLDEAHMLNDIGVQFLGRQFDTRAVQCLCVDLLALPSEHCMACADWRGLVAQLQAGAEGLCALFPVVAQPMRHAWLVDSPQGVDQLGWQQALMGIHAALQQIDIALRAMQNGDPSLVVLAARVQSMAAELDYFSYSPQPFTVRWVDAGHHVALLQSPLNIAQAMQKRLGAVLNPDSNPNAKSWIFTSATLGTDATLSSFVEPCGLQSARCMRVPSPFDYGAQSALYIPADFPHPQHSAHPAAVAALAAEAAAILGGRILLLTTTLRAMYAIADTLRTMDHAGKWDVLLQGQDSGEQLLSRLAQGSLRGKGCILVACGSFWEGVDIVGDALQMVIIDKLPFSPPDDPWVLARAAQTQAEGKSAFMHFHVPQAALALKQGIGRLIRSETDRGVVVVCDVRLVQKGYGKKVIASLPSIRRLETAEQFKDALVALTKPSTTDL